MGRRRLGGGRGKVLHFRERFGSKRNLITDPGRIMKVLLDDLERDHHHDHRTMD